MSTIFTKIVNGEIPAHKVYEDDFTLAFLDIRPIQTGQVLVITKQEFESFEELPEDIYLALMKTVQKVAKKIKAELKPLKVGVIIEGFEVPHVHVKLLPINSEEELRNTTPSSPSDDELAAMADKLKID